jgi:predicted nuclease with RNAse H fold
MEDPSWLIGIDYGSKLAGTTVLSLLPWPVSLPVRRVQSAKGQDADTLILDTIQLLEGRCLIGLDAPLSLPGVYRGLPGCSNYFYREADRSCSAMSPMFLGGLTARAMQLSATLSEAGHPMYEVYPGALARHLELEHYQKKAKPDPLPRCTSGLAALLPFQSPVPENWHQLDSLLALWSAWRILNKEAISFGWKEEGEIFV